MYDTKYTIETQNKVKLENIDVEITVDNIYPTDTYNNDICGLKVELWASDFNIKDLPSLFRWINENSVKIDDKNRWIVTIEKVQDTNNEVDKKL